MNFSLVFKIEYNDFYDIVKCYFNSFISERSIIPSLSKWFFHYLFVLYDGVIFINWYISNLLFHLNAFSRIILIKLNINFKLQYKIRSDEEHSMDRSYLLFKTSAAVYVLICLYEIYIACCWCIYTFSRHHKSH